MGKPEKTFREGSCSSAVFANEIALNGVAVTVKRIAFQKRYKDKNGVWKSSTSLEVDDVPAAVKVLREAYEYVISDTMVPVNQPSRLQNMATDAYGHNSRAAWANRSHLEGTQTPINV